MCPLNFDLAPAPTASTTGMPRSMLTLAVSSTEEIIACVCAMRLWPNCWPFAIFGSGNAAASRIVGATSMTW